ncbi:hypothetical protein TRFO_02919 [Tritrichomonas foetus]|uniref:Kelch motif family protein n=1 Tax=Tritrichomonas foetus TaxID=1144522 RepID=A0A1J4KWA9_9EUKA|nr:hypothetical protein TRFO_02919 [Tritrichomonas foetus]|eukprot:OHT15569.1 hypothetical protein TRFO_02919 [Tritrichomonas foetus]
MIKISKYSKIERNSITGLLFFMGNSASSGKGKSYESGIYVPVNGTRMRGEECAYEPSVIKNNVQQQSLLKTQNFGVWSIKFSDTLGPIPRIGHFTVFDQANSLAYIGYGYGNNGNLLNDVWVINTITLKWRRIPLVGTKIEPRTDASAVLYGRFIYV